MISSRRLRLHSACTMARGATNSKEFTITNFPKCDKLQRAQYRCPHADNRCPGKTEPVLTTVKWKGTQQYLETVPRCFLSCEVETARDTHLRMASSLATATTRRRLSYTRTRRVLWKLTGRSWTSPSRCRQKLNPQIQEGTQRRR